MCCEEKLRWQLLCLTQGRHIASMRNQCLAASLACLHVAMHNALMSLMYNSSTVLVIQGVWASKYNERAFLSMKKVGLNFLDLRMAVLVQRVVPAAYAFVIHTENPTNGAKDEIFAELVAGLGEAIVSGMVPGSSLSFYAKKDALDKPEAGPKLT